MQEKLLCGLMELPQGTQQLLDQAWQKAMNARQCLPQIKGAFGQGVRLVFPADVEGSAPGQINGYGDGSMKRPTSHWLALGGFGTWWPQARLDQSFEDYMPQTIHAHVEENHEGVGLWNCMKGQLGSSTRMELGAYVAALARNAPVHMGTERQSMLSKALMILKAAETWTNDTSPAWRSRRSPFRKPWGLQADGVLWEQAWEGVLQRGHAAQTLSKVKGHATTQQVDEGLGRACDKEGNDWADEFANKGAFQHEPHAVKLAKCLQVRQSAIAPLMTRVHRVVIAVMQAESKERERRLTVQTALQGFDPCLRLAPCRNMKEPSTL